MSIISKKICMIGDFSVGKTSLIRRYMDNQFSDKYLTTVGVKISRKLISLNNYSAGKSLELTASYKDGNKANLNEGEETKLQMLIWDLEGSTRFQGIVPTYLQGASGALIVADITRLNTIDHLGEHTQLFNSINPHSPIIIALNKSDLCLAETQHNMLLDVKQKMYPNILSILHTSAKEDIGVTEAFQILANHIAKS
ncbi:MAG: Rab family GTPase [Pseudanabaena sp. ELA607]|jgi:small GTP-binding protein